MEDTLLSIGNAARRIGVSVDTLRRWERAGRLNSVRSGTTGHRYFRQSDILRFVCDAGQTALDWVRARMPYEPEADVYCATRDIFQAGLERLQSVMGRLTAPSVVSLLGAIVGEIGNNSFDHNLGNWPDIPGIFFSYSAARGEVVLADRGVGILATLKRVRPRLADSKEALGVAFTETLSGRYPETRGNGLKFVRAVVTDSPFLLHIQTGDAYLDLKRNDKAIEVRVAPYAMRGCFATIVVKETV